MEPEDILVVNANKKHSLKGSEDILYAQFSITYQLVSDVFQSVDIIFWCDSTKDESERYEELRQILKILLNHSLETKGNTANFGHIALCYRVLDILSNGYLSRFFKKNYGMSFAEYLTNIRLFHAVDDLLYTSTPITRIAYDNGFASVAIFNKAFKKAYGDTPSAVRKKSKEQKKSCDAFA